MKKILFSLITISLVLPGSVWAQNFFRFSEDAVISQSMDVHDLVVVNGSADIAGRVTGNAVVLHGDITLRNTAYIGGDVICLGGTLTASPGALVRGSKVDIGGKIGWSSLPFYSIAKLVLLIFLYKLVSALILIFLTIFLVMMWPNQIRLAGEEASVDLIKSCLVGILAIATLIPLTIGFAATLFGLPIALALFIFLLVADWFGVSTVAYLVGKKFSQRLSPVPGVILGLVILQIIRFVPFIGGLLYFIAVLPGLGAILLTRFGTNKSWLSRNRASH